MSKKEYPRPKKRTIDQESVSVFLASIGFSTEFISQEWRHLTAFGTYNNKDAVFKLASTIPTSFYTQKEYYWNEAVHATPESHRKSFTVPENFSSGWYGKLYYFIALRFMSQPFATPMSAIDSSIARYIPQIAAATREIQLLPISKDLPFARHTRSKTDTSVGQKLVNAATEWASQVPKDLSVFLSILEDAKDYVRSCPSHGDFVIRQMYDVNGKIGIIDGEHAGYKAAYHLDVAQFYLRLCNDHHALELAKLYLCEFYALLPKGEQDTFWEELRLPLIQRYIGDLWGAAKNPDRLAQLEVMGQEILENRILV
jgi:hypothetical protein